MDVHIAARSHVDFSHHTVGAKKSTYHPSRSLPCSGLDQNPERKPQQSSEARRIAVNIANLPALVTKGGSNGDR